MSANWDGLTDSLFGGLHGLGVERVAIVWPDSKRLLATNPDEYSIAADTFTELVFTLADPKYTGDHVTRLLVFLA